ncbi:hypothetical protein ACOSQ2_030096 [Xanthoceras sorbifolium]
MAAQIHVFRFVFLPHLAQGHLIPMIRHARLLAQRGLAVIIISTPLNASRFKTIIDRAIESGLHIQSFQVPFPSLEAGLPEGYESMDTHPSRDMFKSLLIAIGMLQKPIEKILDELQPRPSCIISDKILAWSHHTAQKYGIPRLVFDRTSCFTLVDT